ncbi:PaaI family thioesterase [Nocardia vermiculata]|uniref:PaaI family thioesterase n=1 Tax=Nocardia vermiculata TaxID=257274 RepID=A0A846YCF1_9NOCA|nr:PaaI family thioesterase [Nocardia vermiculata]NKY54479.1 PaaI family thioesterase [Nocardia vermiculata]
MQITLEDIDSAEIERRAALYGPLTEAVRELVDATIRTEVDDQEIREVETLVRAATARLRRRQLDGAFGVRHTAAGKVLTWGNAAVGLRNAIAPPLVIHRDELGRRHCEVTLGAAYEGPPGLVHGGVCALILDQILGMTAAVGGKPRLTGTLTITYRAGTPLGPIRLDAWVERVEGIKTYAAGSISAGGTITVEAHGVFIAPRGTRDTSE